MGERKCLAGDRAVTRCGLISILPGMHSLSFTPVTLCVSLFLLLPSKGKEVPTSAKASFASLFCLHLLLTSDAGHAAIFRVKGISMSGC